MGVLTWNVRSRSSSRRTVHSGRGFSAGANRFFRAPSAQRPDVRGERPDFRRAQFFREGRHLVRDAMRDDVADVAVAYLHIVQVGAFVPARIRPVAVGAAVEEQCPPVRDQFGRCELRATSRRRTAPRAKAEDNATPAASRAGPRDLIAGKILISARDHHFPAPVARGGHQSGRDHDRQQVPAERRAGRTPTGGHPPGRERHEQCERGPWPSRLPRVISSPETTAGTAPIAPSTIVQ